MQTNGVGPKGRTMTSYFGRRTEKGVGAVGEVSVFVRSSDGSEKRLDPRLDLVNHSPTGFNWGYGGAGPAQLALALLADYLATRPDEIIRIAEKFDDGDVDPRRFSLADRLAARLHQDFKWEVTARLPDDADWTLTDDQISRVLAALCARRTS